VKKIKVLILQYWEVLSYLLFGVLTTVVNYLVYLPVYNLLGLSAAVSNAIAWVVAVAFAYVTNKIWVFHSKVKEPAAVLKEAAKFVSSRAATGVLEVLGVPFLILLGMDQKIFGIDGMLAKMVVSVIVVIANYVLSKWLVFNNKKPETRH